MRTETFRRSFIPSTITMWNNLEMEKRNLNAIADLCKFEPNELFFFGNRLKNIQHAQLRMHCSKLNAHLFSLHVVDSPACSCGYNIEDSNHYLLKCPLFHTPRVKMLASVASELPMNITIDANLLLHGSKTIKQANLRNMFKAVHCFIEETKRL